MGLGLHITNEIMKSHKGKLIFPEYGDYNIPEEYQKGAQLILSFKI
jgi:signal transduction histidine kinase